MSDTPRPKRGGSDTARERGLVGVVVHLTPDDRKLVGGAAGLDGLSVKEFFRRAGVEAAKERLRKKK